MKVNVELTDACSIDGLTSLCEIWRTQFPLGKLIGATAYGRIVITLEMPPATQVVPPQITDARAEVYEYADRTTES